MTLDAPAKVRLKIRAAVSFIKATLALATAFMILVLLILIAVAFLALLVTAQWVCPFAQCSGEATDLWAFAAFSSVVGIPTVLLLLLMIYYGRRR